MVGKAVARSISCIGAMIVALSFGIGTSARAAPFELYESVQSVPDPFGGSYLTGQYTLVNNTTDLLVAGFVVTNPLAIREFAIPYVAGLDGWVGDYDDATFGTNAFSYYTAFLESYLGTGSYPNFFWSPAVIASNYIVFYVDGQGAEHSFQGVTSATPIPAALPLMGSILGVGFVVLRRRRRISASLDIQS